MDQRSRQLSPADRAATTPDPTLVRIPRSTRRMLRRRVGPRRETEGEIYRLEVPWRKGVGRSAGVGVACLADGCQDRCDTIRPAPPPVRDARRHRPLHGGQRPDVRGDPVVRVADNRQRREGGARRGRGDLCVGARGPVRRADRGPPGFQTHQRPRRPPQRGGGGCDPAALRDGRPGLLAAALAGLHRSLPGHARRDGAPEPGAGSFEDGRNARREGQLRLPGDRARFVPGWAAACRRPDRRCWLEHRPPARRGDLRRPAGRQQQGRPHRAVTSPSSSRVWSSSGATRSSSRSPPPPRPSTP